MKAGRSVLALVLWLGLCHDRCLKWVTGGAVATTLKDMLLTEEVRPRLVDDCCSLLDRQVAAKKGLSGMAIKGAYKTVKAIKPGFVRGVVNVLLDDWVDRLEGFEAQRVASGTSAGLSEYVIGRKTDVAQALVAVTDERADGTRHKTAKKLYFRLRPSALSNVEEAIPDLARLVETYVDAAA